MLQSVPSTYSTRAYIFSAILATAPLYTLCSVRYAHLERRDVVVVDASRHIQPAPLIEPQGRRQEHVDLHGYAGTQRHNARNRPHGTEDGDIHFAVGRKEKESADRDRDARTLP